MPRTVCSEQRIGRIALDLAAQAVDLHVDRALVDRAAVAGERHARHGLARRRRQHAQHLALAVGEADDLVALAQFAARRGETRTGRTARDSDGRLRRRRARLRMLAMRSDSSRGSNGLAT